jgi:hypothetical protein
VVDRVSSVLKVNDLKTGYRIGRRLVFEGDFDPVTIANHDVGFVSKSCEQVFVNGAPVAGGREENNLLVQRVFLVGYLVSFHVDVSSDIAARDF